MFIVPVATRSIFRGAVSLIHSFTWWQGLFVLCFISGIVWRVRELQDINSQPVDGFALFRVGLQGFVGLVLLFRLLTYKTDWLRPLFPGIIGIVAIFPLLSLVSTAWSVRPGWTFYKSIEYLVDLSTLAAIMISIRSTEEVEHLVDIAWSLLGVMLLSAWIGAIVDPMDALKLGRLEGPLTGRLNGIIPNIDANSVGEWSAILAIVALGRLTYDPENKFNGKWYRILFASAIVTLIYAQTRAATAGFVVATMVLALLSRRYLRGALFAAAGLLAIALLSVTTNAGAVLLDYLLRGQSLQAVRDVSGRADWWHYAIFKFWQRPWVGYGGYAGGGRFVVLAGIGRYETGDILSSWVQPLIDTGVLGFTALVIAIGALWSTLLKSAGSSVLDPATKRLLIEIICVMTIIQIRSFFTGNLITHDAMPFLIVLGCAEFSRRLVNLRLNHEVQLP
jgi:O-Antigen ligase